MPKQKPLTLAFKELRKLGYFARQNFWCCQSCAWSAMNDEEAKKTVFYHRQDAYNLKEDGNCYLAWSGNGKEIVSVFNKHGIETDWDESPNTRIKITIPKN